MWEYSVAQVSDVALGPLVLSFKSLTFPDNLTKAAISNFTDIRTTLYPVNHQYQSFNSVQVQANGAYFVTYRMS